MSEPANTSALVLLDPTHHHHHSHHHVHHTTPPPPGAQPSSSPPSPPSSSALARDYRKGNWTLHETLILINAKRMDDERRVLKQCGGGGGAGTPRTAELRWKWVENYCWKNGCLRSQNQCNDKWDNLLRDYKKVRDYEAKASGSSVSSDGAEARPSYWAMEKHERKERNLPSNLAAEVFEALMDVLSRRNAQRTGATPVSSRPPPPPLQPPPPPPPPLQEHPAPPPPPPPPPPLPPQPSVSVEASEETSGSEDGGNSVGSGGKAKRRRVRRSVVQGASLLARTLLSCEEKREKRHREMMELEERRLRIEEDRSEMNRQGFAGLIAAVNSLSGAIHALVSQHHRRHPDPN